jgi:hypothetical protein
MGTGGRSGMDGGRPRDSAAPAGPLLRIRTSRWISQDLKRERAKGKGKGRRAKGKGQGVVPWAGPPYDCWLRGAQADVTPRGSSTSVGLGSLGSLSWG